MRLKRVVTKSLAIILSMTCILAGCNNGNSTETSNINETSSTETGAEVDDFNTNPFDITPVSMSDDFEITDEDRELYNSLFDLKNKVTVSIDISEEELAKIQADYDYYNSMNSKSPIYRKCNLTITINDKSYVIEEVGVRMKGNTSRKPFYDEESGVYALIHFKFSFKQTFDNEEYYGDDAKVWNSEEERDERKNRTFASLEGLEMKWNRNIDSTYTRETYAYKMYRDFGILAPNNTLGQCMVNGENWGLYKIYEPVDEVFVERYLDKEDWGGDLYKCTWGNGPANYTSAGKQVGVENEQTANFYTYDLKTNKKTSNHESIKNFISRIKDTNLTTEKVNELIDIDYWLKFFAVSYFLGMPDDMRNNYNNHYIYFKASSNQAIFIAYDCEISLGSNGWNPTGNYMTETDPYSGKAYGNDSAQQNKLIVNTIGKNGILKERYKVALDLVADSKWMQNTNFREMYKISEKLYDEVDIPEIENLKKDREIFEMDLYDVYSAENVSNGNMPVDEFLAKMLMNYGKYR